MAITIAVLKAAGLSDELIGQIVAIAEEMDTERRRSQGAARVAEWRKRQKSLPHIAPPPVVDVGKVPIPKGWKPDMSVLMLADQLGLDDAQRGLELERFRDYMLANAVHSADWNARCRSWFNSPFFAKGLSNGRPTEHYLKQWDRAYAQLDRAARGSDAFGTAVVTPIRPQAGGRPGSVHDRHSDGDDPLPF